MLGVRVQFTGVLMLLGLWLGVRSLPIHVEPSPETLEPQRKSELRYKRYLTEVERILKQDPHFRAKLKNATVDDLMLKKVYAEDTDDNAEQTELERTRMRNHLLAEVDANKDRLVSLSEFLESTQSARFSQNEEWETSDQKPLFSEEELREFEQRLAENIAPSRLRPLSGSRRNGKGQRPKLQSSKQQTSTSFDLLPGTSLWKKDTI